MSFRVISTLLMKTAWLLVLCVSTGCINSLAKGDSGAFCGVNNPLFEALEESEQTHTLSTKQLELCEKLGISWQRVPMPRDYVQSHDGSFKWDLSDQVVNELIAGNQEILGVLAHSSDRAGHYPPATTGEREDFGRYVAGMVGRYGERIKAWEVWNHPNMEDSWAPHPDAHLYLRLLETSHRAAKKADKDCLVVAPALKGLDFRFLESLYQQNAQEYLDVLSFHYKPTNPDFRQLQRDIIDLQYFLERFGDGEKKIWITNLDMPTSDQVFDSGKSASWMIKALVTAASSNQVERIFMESLSPPGNTRSFIFADNDLNLNPAGIAFQTMIRLLGNMKYQGPLAIRPDVQAPLFTRGNKAIAVLWSSGGEQTINLPCNANLTRFDLSGRKKTLKPGKEMITFSITEAPQYLEGSRDDFKLVAGFMLEPEVIHLIPGGKGDLILHLENPYPNKVLRGRMILDAPPAISIEPEEFSFDLAKGETIKKRLPVTVSNQAPVGFYTIQARAVLETPLHHAMTASGIARINPPLRISIRGKQKDGKFNVETQIVNTCTENLSGRIRWKLRPRGKVEAIPLSFTNLRPNDEITTVSGLMAGNKEACLVSSVMLDGGCQMEQSIGLMSIPFRLIGPRVDGNLREWVDVPTLHLDKEFQRTDHRTGREWSKQDVSGVFQFWLTKQDIYLAADITDDDSLVNPNQGPDISKGDCIELFLGLDGPVERNWFGDLSFHLGINPGHKGRLPRMWNWKSRKPVDGAKIVTLRKETGYLIEARIPFTELGGWRPKHYTMIGFDVALCDLDNGREATPGATLSWNGRPEGRWDPSSWGLAIIH